MFKRMARGNLSQWSHTNACAMSPAVIKHTVYYMETACLKLLVRDCVTGPDSGVFVLVSRFI